MLGSLNCRKSLKRKKALEGPQAGYLELKLPAALADVTGDLKTWEALELILDPKPVDVKPPEDYCCPITGCLMRDPVVTADGQTYEREAIEIWLVKNNTSPLSGRRQLKNKDLISVIFVKNSIRRFMDKHPALQDSKERYLPQAWINELASACQAGDEKTIQALANRDRRLLVHTFEGEGHKGKTALQLAATGHEKALETVVALLEKRQPGLALAGLLQADASGRLPLHHAILAKQGAGMLLKLVAWMGKVMDRLTLPDNWPEGFHSAELDVLLLWSINQQAVATLRYLLALGAKPNSKSALGETPLYRAVQKGFQAGLTVLLEAKADPNLRDSRLLEDTPLRRGVRERALDIAGLLQHDSASLNYAGWDGSAPLHFFEAHGSRVKLSPLGIQGELVAACEQGNLKAVQLAIGQGAKANLADAQGKEPLGAAVWGMNPEVVKTLAAEMQGVTTLTWEECEAHNVKHYQEVFMFAEFNPKTYGEWHQLLLKMQRSPFLAAHHLAEARKVGQNDRPLSWKTLVTCAEDWYKGWEAWCLWEWQLIMRRTHDYHSQLRLDLIHVLNRRQPYPRGDNR